MAFRTEEGIGALLILSAAGFAQPFSYPVRHEHLHGGAMGTLEIGAGTVAFKEQSKGGKDSRQWTYEDIQQLSLSAGTLRLITYQDQKWQLGRDREFVFDRLPAGMAKRVSPFLESKLGRRLVTELAEAHGRALWQMSVKLRRGLGGSQGTLVAEDGRLVYETDARGQSRTWRFADIDNVSASGPYELEIMTLERSGWRHAGPTEFRFQLKEALSEERYNELWRRVEEVKAGRGRMLSGSIN